MRFWFIYVDSVLLLDDECYYGEKTRDIHTQMCGVYSEMRTQIMVY